MSLEMWMSKTDYYLRPENLLNNYVPWEDPKDASFLISKCTSEGTANIIENLSCKC